MVFVVCGGVKSSIEEFKEFEEIVVADADAASYWHVQIDGRNIQVPKSNEGKY